MGRQTRIWQSIIPPPTLPAITAVLSVLHGSLSTSEMYRKSYSHYSVWINSPLVHPHISLTGVEVTVVVRVIVLVHGSISEIQKPDRHWVSFDRLTFRKCGHLTDWRGNDHITGWSGRYHGNDSNWDIRDLRTSARLNDGCSCLSTSHSGCKCSDRRTQRYISISYYTPKRYVAGL